MTRFFQLAFCTLLFLLCAAFGLIALKQRRILAAIEQTAATAAAENQRQREELRGQIAEAEAERKIALTQMALIAKKEKDNEKPSPAAKPSSALAQAHRSNEILRSHPDYARFWRRQQRRYLQERLGALFDELQLEPGKLEKFKDLLVEKSQSMRDAGQLVVEHGMDSGSQAYAKAVRRASSEVEKDMQALLGAKDFAKYQAFEKAAVHRSTVEDFQTTLADRGLPTLSPAQERALAEAYRDVRDPRRNPRFRELAASGGLQSEAASQQIRELVAPSLTPEQLQVLATFQEHTTARLEVFGKLMKLQP